MHQIRQRIAVNDHLDGLDEAETRINECQASAATCQRAAGGAFIVVEGADGAGGHELCRQVQSEV